MDFPKGRPLEGRRAQVFEDFGYYGSLNLGDGLIMRDFHKHSQKCNLIIAHFRNSGLCLPIVKILAGFYFFVYFFINLY